MSKLTESEQYQIYLTLLETLRNNGYETAEFENKKNCIRTSIKRGSNNYGEVAIVAPPGLMGAIMESKSVHSSDFTVMHSAMELKQTQFQRKGYNLFKDFNPERCRVRTIWSPDDVICCCTSEPNAEYLVDEWLEIVKPILGVTGGGLPNELPVALGPGDKKKGCYVATCVYGSYDCPEVWTLRRFRDNTLSSMLIGRMFIRGYYAISPKIVELFGETKWFHSLWKPMIDNMVVRLQNSGVDSSPYKG